MALTFATSWTDVTVALGTVVTGVGAVVGLYLTAAAAKRERARHEQELVDERQASANYLAEQRAAAIFADRKRYILATLSEAATSYGQLAAVASDPARSNVAGILAATVRLKLASLPGEYAVMMRLGLRLPLTPAGQKKLDWLRTMGYLPFDFQPGESRIEPDAIYTELEGDVEALLLEIPDEWRTLDMGREGAACPQSEEQGDTAEPGPLSDEPQIG